MRNKHSFIVGGIILTTGVVVGLIISSGFDVTRNTHSSPPPFEAPSNVVLGAQDTIPEKLLALQNTSEAFIYIAENVVPTVVSVKSTRVVSASDMERFHDQEDLRDFFRFHDPREFRQQGSGSGIIVSKDGYILTNVHVVDNSDRIRVTLYDNREFESRIIGLDPLTEVAVIKIDADNLPVARLGNSDGVRVGEWVLAVGNPLDLRSTVTAGIISAKERQIDIIRDTYSVESFLQTDAAINPGNSGGALVNLRGEVIGVNTAIATETGYSAGFGFAIPITLAKKIMSDLIYKGRVTRGYLGIGMQNINEKKAKALGMDKPRGVFISQVMAGAPADSAGIKTKDVLLKIDGQEVNRSNQVQAIIAKKNPNDRVELEILRDGRIMKLDVLLGLREMERATFSQDTNAEKFENLGLKVETLSRAKAEELNRPDLSGVLVKSVERWSPADDAGIRENDIIVEIDDRGIEDEDDFHASTAELSSGDVAIFTIQRRGETLHLFVEVVK